MHLRSIGTKAVGVSSLQKYLGVSECESLHLGDQFSVTGNDMAARNVAATCWVISPIETRKCLKTILFKRG
jgi:IMP and pyridine-specific 5'-nucleotidase